MHTVIKGKNDLTGNDYDKKLSEGILYSVHPKRVRYDDETGERIKD